jgi:hypothetical protein
VTEGRRTYHSCDPLLDALLQPPRLEEKLDSIGVCVCGREPGVQVL